MRPSTKGETPGPRAHRLRYGTVGAILALLGSLAMAGCGSGHQAASLCQTVDPALRNYQQLENQIANNGANSVSDSRVEQAFTILSQALDKASPDVPPGRRASFQSVAGAFRQAKDLLRRAGASGASGDQLLSQAAPLLQEHASEAKANTAYILQRCGGRNAVFGATAPSSTG